MAAPRRPPAAPPRRLDCRPMSDVRCPRSPWRLLGHRELPWAAFEPLEACWDHLVLLRRPSGQRRRPDGRRRRTTTTTTATTLWSRKLLPGR
eukprot:7629138-Pyramimonas_sp.AAC.1